jgi:hypothetical protein
MQCFECGQPAVAICRWCGVALCRTHLARSLDERARGPEFTMACLHRMPTTNEREKKTQTST